MKKVYVHISVFLLSVIVLAVAGVITVYADEYETLPPEYSDFSD